MFVAFLNPQGNFDANDSHWTEHPDFGGQLVYVKEVACELAALRHRIDIITRQVIDPEWPEFSDRFDGYQGVENVRIVRIPCGPDEFLPKEELWPYLGPAWVPNILAFYHREGRIPEVITAHYGDGGLAATLIYQQEGIPFTFTAHSLGALKMENLNVNATNIVKLNGRYRFARRIIAERLSMNHAAKVITSTLQERRMQYAHQAYEGAIEPENDRRFALIPPGVNRRVFNNSAGAGDDEVRQRIEQALFRDINVDRRHLPLILASSRLDPKKNQLGLVDAFASSEELQGVANLALVVRGLEDPLREYELLDPTGRSTMEAITARMHTQNLWGKVTAFPLNGQSELAAAYRTLSKRKSVFALTAFYEPFGLAPLEAMSCGLPVVVTRNGGPGESLEEEGNEFGVLVDPKDTEDIARGLLRLLRSDKVWREFRALGLERVDQRYTWDRTASAYGRVLETIRAEQPRQGGLEIPPYFTDTGDKTDAPLRELKRLYLKT